MLLGHTIEAERLRVWGEVDLASATDLKEIIERASTSSDGHVIVDIGGISFIDAAGINALVAADLALQDNGHRLMLVSVPEIVKRLFRIAMVPPSWCT